MCRLALLLLLAALLPLSAYLAGIIPGGGHRPDPEKHREATRQPGRLKVTVIRAEDRSPVQGAIIQIRGLSSGQAEATSDTEGKATLDGLGAEPVRVEVTADGRTNSAWANPDAEDEILLAVASRPVRKAWPV